ncbi:hypothetical protein BA920_03465 [Helicobacter pullorum]|nr:hypothetical protein BA920_03465 [Helicobacter pullorum]
MIISSIIQNLQNSKNFENITKFLLVKFISFKKNQDSLLFLRGSCMIFAILRGILGLPNQASNL